MNGTWFDFSLGLLCLVLAGFALVYRRKHKTLTAQLRGKYRRRLEADDWDPAPLFLQEDLTDYEKRLVRNLLEEHQEAELSKQ